MAVATVDGVVLAVEAAAAAVAATAGRGGVASMVVGVARLVVESLECVRAMVASDALAFNIASRSAFACSGLATYAHNDNT